MAIYKYFSTVDALPLMCVPNVCPETYKPQSAPNAAVVGELGIFPIFVKTNIQFVKYWRRLEFDWSIPHLLKEAYSLSKSLANHNVWFKNALLPGSFTEKLF